MSKIFARPLTKDYLQKHGVKEITEDCKVIFDDGRVLEKEEDFTKDKKGYLSFNVYELDENGNRIRIPITRRYKYKGYEKLSNTHTYKVRTIYLHRAMWAWVNGEVPEGLFAIHHITNRHDTLADNKLENLQLISQIEHARKDRTLSARELKCKMSLPLSYYEDKLNTYLNKYNNAKSKEEKHLLVAYICKTKARIRYWKSHEEEYKKNEEANALKTQKERASDIRELRKNIKEAHEAYTKNKTSDNRYIWKLSIENLKKYLELHPFKGYKI